MAFSVVRLKEEKTCLRLSNVDGGMYSLHHNMQRVRAQWPIPHPTMKPSPVLFRTHRSQALNTGSKRPMTPNRASCTGPVVPAIPDHNSFTSVLPHSSVPGPEYKQQEAKS